MQITTTIYPQAQYLYCNWLSPKCKSQRRSALVRWSLYCNWLSPKCKSQPGLSRASVSLHCNWLSPKCKSQRSIENNKGYRIVTDYRLNANHNSNTPVFHFSDIVTDYRLNANHNKHIREIISIYCNWLSPKCKSQLSCSVSNTSLYCNWLSPKCKSQLFCARGCFS